MSERAKVLLLGPLPPPYMGPAIATEILLGSALKDRFHLVHLDTNTHRDLATLNTFRLGGAFKNVASYARLMGLVARHRPALVVVPISQTTLGFFKDSWFILISRAMGRKVLLHLRGSEFRVWLARSSPLTRGYVRTVLAACCGVIVLGEKLRYLFEGFFPQDWIFVVPNGANLSFPSRQDGKSALRILHLSNLKRPKGVEDVVAAFVNVAEQDPSLDLQLDLAGSWIDQAARQSCESMATPFAGRVHVHPAVLGLEKQRLYLEADVFVFPPRQPEGHPWVLVEAMAAGLPIVATDQGAITESVVDGVNGFIVPVGDADAIAAKLNLLVHDDALRRRMGEASRKRYEERFTEERMVDGLTRVFEQVMAK
jgi:glycosyltransferase involved in cell wall biosynthesis